MKSYFKRFMAAMMAMMLLMSITACGKKNEETPEADEHAQEATDVFEAIEEIAEENADAEVGEYVTAGDAAFVWEEIEGGVAIKEYIGEDKAIIIPEQLGGQPVLEIRSGAFADGSVLGVKLPNSLVIVNEKAFLYCTSLVEVEMGAAVTEIGLSAFEGCVALQKVVLNDGLETISRMAFATTPSLRNIVFPSSLKKIGEGAFVLGGLEEITVPGSVEKLEWQAFSDCNNLKKVVIEEGVLALQDEVFNSCDALETIEIPGSVNEFGWDVLGNCPNVVIYAPAGSPAEAYANEFGRTFKSN